MQFSSDDLDSVQELAGCNYGPREIALFIKCNLSTFMKEWSTEGSELRDAYDRGLLYTEAEISMKMAEQAKAGSQTAAQIFQKGKAARDFEADKLRILYGNG